MKIFLGKPHLWLQQIATTCSQLQQNEVNQHVKIAICISYYFSIFNLQPCTDLYTYSYNTARLTSQYVYIHAIYTPIHMDMYTATCIHKQTHLYTLQQQKLIQLHTCMHTSCMCSLQKSNPWMVHISKLLERRVTVTALNQLKVVAKCFQGTYDLLSII